MITLEYPGYSPTQLLTVKSPEFGEQKETANEMQVHLTLSGHFKTIVKKSFKDSYRTTLEFLDLCLTDKQALLAFLRLAQDHYIKYTDPDSVIWIIQIENDPEIIDKKSTFDISLDILRWEP